MPWSLTWTHGSHQQSSVSHCWPSRHTQLGSHTWALQSLPHMSVLFKYTCNSERFGLEYTAVPFPTERDGGIRKVLWGYTIIWLQVREDSSPESPTWVLAGHWKWVTLLDSSILSLPRAQTLEKATISAVVDSILVHP